MFGDSFQNVINLFALFHWEFAAEQIVVSRHSSILDKACVAHMEALATPRLELQATLLAPPVQVEVHRALTMQSEQLLMWIDSETMFFWLHSSYKQLFFASDSVAEILELLMRDEWNHVQSTENSVEASTRGIAASALPEGSCLEDTAFLRKTGLLFYPHFHFLKDPLDHASYREYTKFATSRHFDNSHDSQH